DCMGIGKSDIKRTDRFSIYVKAALPFIIGFLLVVATVFVIAIAFASCSKSSAIVNGVGKSMLAAKIEHNDLAEGGYDTYLYLSEDCCSPEQKP
ncbi:hypothetical protein, partial [Bacteroides pyogenes]|uniref:hypothetical protein n=1 Tax=Bacteroides pyogenes TaxID=310300 RepID=UPI002A91D41E